MARARVRRRPDEARRQILDAAEALLVEGGPAAVQMRAIAARVDMTDAGVAHHFGTRDALLDALLRHGGRKIREAVEETTARWLQDGPSVDELVRGIAAVYEQGYGELAISLHAAGWRDTGSGLLEPVVEALHGLRPPRGSRRPPRRETRLAVAALHQALATESAYGAAFRRSAGIEEPAASDSSAQVEWWIKAIATLLEIDAGRRAGVVTMARRR